MTKPSRLRALQTSTRVKVINRILPECFDEVELDYNKAIPIHASDAEGTGWLLTHEELNPSKFGGVSYKGGQDYAGLTSLELHQLANGEKIVRIPRPRGSK